MAAKAAKPEDIYSVKVQSLDQNTGKTILGQYAPQIRDFYLKNVVPDGNKVGIPSLGYLLKLFPDLSQKLYDKYMSVMASQKDLGKVDDKLKVLQGALFDGLCYVYDVKNDKVLGLYTMNFHILTTQTVPMGSANPVKTTYDYNSDDKKLNLYKIKTTYTYADKEFDFTKTHPTKTKITGDEETTALIPYVCIYELMSVIEDQLSTGTTFRVIQGEKAPRKTRFVTTNTTRLKKYCDDPTMIDATIKPAYYTVNAEAYIPVLGAPSTTAMVTRINLFDLAYMDSYKPAMKTFYRTSDPVGESLADSDIVAKLMPLKSSQTGMDTLNKLLRAKKLPKVRTFGKAEDMSPVSISEWLHSLNEKEKKAVYQIFKSDEAAEKQKKALNLTGYRPMTDAEKADMYGMTKQYVCRFYVQRKNGHQVSITGTNNEAILEAKYGKNYGKYYDSFSVKIYKFVAKTSNNPNVDFAETLDRYGLKYDDNAVKELKTALVDPEYRDKAVKILAPLNGKNADYVIRRMKSNDTQHQNNSNTFTVKQIDAYLVDGEPKNWTSQSIDPNEVRKAFVYEGSKR